MGTSRCASLPSGKTIGKVEDVEEWDFLNAKVNIFMAANFSKTTKATLFEAAFMILNSKYYFTIDLNTFSSSFTGYLALN